MGAKTSMLAFVDGDAAAILKSTPQLDRDACRAALAELFPGEKMTELSDGNLAFAYPPRKELMIACFPGLTILATRSIASEPSRLDRRYLAYARGRTILQHVMISTVDAFAYGVWEHGELRRGLSMDSDNGLGENIGQPRPFELPYWAGEHREEDAPDNGLPFHPLELAEAALLDLFGYQLEGDIDPEQVDPETIPMMRFTRQTRWWKFW